MNAESWLLLVTAGAVGGLGRAAYLYCWPIRRCKCGVGCRFCNLEGKRARFGAKTVCRVTGKPLPDKIR